MKIEEKEKIYLDATLGNALNLAAFRAVLSNGHTFTAFYRGFSPENEAKLCPGRGVKVCFSPFDMAQASIVSQEFEGENHEG